MLVPRSFLNSTPPALPPKRLTPILRFSVMLIGYMRVSSSDERQVVDLQLDALLAAGVDERHLHQDKQSGGRKRPRRPASLPRWVACGRCVGGLEARSPRPLALAPRSHPG